MSQPYKSAARSVIPCLFCSLALVASAESSNGSECVGAPFQVTIGHSLLLRPMVREELGMTDPQCAEVLDVARAQGIVEVATLERDVIDPTSGEETNVSLDNANKIVDEELAKILTEYQWEALKDIESKADRGQSHREGLSG